MLRSLHEPGDCPCKAPQLVGLRRPCALHLYVHCGSVIPKSFPTRTRSPAQRLVGQGPAVLSQPIWWGVSMTQSLA